VIIFNFQFVVFLNIILEKLCILFNSFGKGANIKFFFMLLVVCKMIQLKIKVMFSYS